MRRRLLREGDGANPPQPWEELHFASERAAMEELEHPVEPIRGAWLYRVAFPLTQIVEDAPQHSERRRVYVVRPEGWTELTLPAPMPQLWPWRDTDTDPAPDVVAAWDDATEPRRMFGLLSHLGAPLCYVAAFGVATALARLIPGTEDFVADLARADLRHPQPWGDAMRERYAWHPMQGKGIGVAALNLARWDGSLRMIGVLLAETEKTLQVLLDGAPGLEHRVEERARVRRAVGGGTAADVSAFLCRAARDAVTVDAVALALEMQALERLEVEERRAKLHRAAALATWESPPARHYSAARGYNQTVTDTELVFAEVEALFRRRSFGVDVGEMLRDAMMPGGPLFTRQILSDVRAEATMGGTNYTVTFANGAELTLTGDGRRVRSSYDTRTIERDVRRRGSDDMVDALAYALDGVANPRP